ncbi:MAG TPA: cytochrome d ubiquinol oxidase subunit II [Trebonia sp.]|nr:cytochrome d ubiquinol oxidase subunit II [Trebonia sp.]
MADLAAAVLVLIVTAYAALAGADFGGGIWDLLAGGTRRGLAPRRRIDRSVTPVWEANHVWLVIALVVFWTSFPAAFADVFTTLFVPLSVAALGIVLRGSGFAFRAQLRSLRWQAVTGGAFAIASLLTPFFLGTVVGSVAAGQVHGASDDPVASWTNLTSLLTGALFVVTGAYLAAVFLAVDSERAGEPELRVYFIRRAVAAAVASGVLAAVTMAVLHTSARPLFTELTAGRGLPLVVISVVAGVAVLAALLFDVIRVVRPLAVLAVAAVIWGWAIGQYPSVLPGRLTIAGAAAPRATLAAEVIVVAIIVVLVAPSFALLFRLALANRLAEADDPHAGPWGQPGSRGGRVAHASVRDSGQPQPGYLRLAAAAVVAAVAVRQLRRSRR